ncbi:polysaccharide deacetylase family protein [Nocardioides carbamazepini]|uniref:polysaccharide deacetylase family protein n=1 Tax=Nocardioides carbamazepini TaxID=2854259 RepID=UPI002149EB8D|nr:polysaccharide deacetylase family protein [Nocardioides carbamazepini]MCR1781750.1 polysaccharide deacetylase family protein [Nocardioides carbamazepini]
MLRPVALLLRPVVLVLVALLGPALASPAVATPPEQAPRSDGCTGVVALTFDDGPARGTTRRLIRVLKRSEVPATFFMVGQRVAADPRAAREVERAGFLTANHSWSHRDMRTQSYREVRQSLRATRRAMKRAGLHPTDLMRPPYGALAPPARRAIRDAGYVPVMWSADSLDWKSGNAQQIARRILSELRPGRNIVLQHDGVNRSPISVAAVSQVVRTAQRRGYCFTALNERGRPGFPTPTMTTVAKDGVEGGEAVVRLELDRAPGRDTAVVVEAVSGTASVGTDLPAFHARVVIPAGRLTAKVRIPISSDAVVEPTEHVTLRLRHPEGLTLGQETVQVAIIDAAGATRIDLPEPPFLLMGPKHS